MFLLFISLCFIIYFRGFWVMNYFKDYFLSGINREKYVSQEIELISYLQKSRKQIVEDKDALSHSYTDKLADEDSKIANQIVLMRLSSMYKKYALINTLNNELLITCVNTIDIIVNKNYNHCLSLLLGILSKKVKQSKSTLTK